MPLMSSFYTGVSGMLANQNALHVTAHNLSNINTEGYVRQQAGMADGLYSNIGFTAVNTKQIGLGVVSAESRHIRDLLLDTAYREQAGRQQYYASKYEVSEEVETILGELEGVQFQQSLEDLKEAINEMAKTPDSTVSRAGLIMCGEAFISRANAIYEELTSYQQTLDRKVLDCVEEINSIGKQIAALNLKIASVEGPNVETASDYRDSRDVLLDRLGELAKIDYSEDENGVVTVRLEGTSFITKDGIFEMGTAQVNGDKGSTYLTPVWPHIDDAQVFDTRATISAAKNTDIGELKGVLVARGDFVGTYSDIPHEPDYGSFATDVERVAAYEQYQKDVREYNETVGNTMITKAQALLDQMVKHIVTTINDALSPTVEKTMNQDVTFTITAGTVVKTLDKTLQDKLSDAAVDKDGALLADASITVNAGEKLTILNIDEDENGCSFGCDEDSTPGTEMFSRMDVERYTKVEGSDGKAYYIYNPYNEFGNESVYSLGNICMNQKVVDDYAFLPFTTENKDVDIELGEKILKLWAEPSLNLDPNNETPKDFDDYYTAMVGILSNEGYMSKTISESQSMVVLNIETERQSVIGVSQEEELSNMIKFKNAYDASSRYINAVTEMLDVLINRLGS